MDKWWEILFESALLSASKRPLKWGSTQGPSGKSAVFLRSAPQSGQCKEGSLCSLEQDISHEHTVVGLDSSWSGFLAIGFKWKIWSHSAVGEHQRSLWTPRRAFAALSGDREWSRARVGMGPNNLTEDLVIELPFHWGEKHTNITLESKLVIGIATTQLEIARYNRKTLWTSTGYGGKGSCWSEFNESICIWTEPWEVSRISRI